MTQSIIYKTLFTTVKQTGGGLINIYDKKYFLFKVLLTLIVQLNITYFVMTKTNIKIHKYLLFLMNIILILILALVPMPMPLKFIIFSLFSFIMGIMLSKLNVDQETIKFALLGTMSIFISMMTSGILLLMMGIKFGIKMFSFLFMSLLGLIIVGLLQLFTSVSINTKIYSSISIFIFSLFILYDTNKILQRDYMGDFITASIDYYLDIINIFINLINYRK